MSGRHSVTGQNRFSLHELFKSYITVQNWASKEQDYHVIFVKSFDSTVAFAKISGSFAAFSVIKCSAWLYPFVCPSILLSFLPSFREIFVCQL